MCIKFAELLHFSLVNRLLPGFWDPAKEPHKN